MPPPESGDPNSNEETIVEAVVRRYLNKAEIDAMLEAMGKDPPRKKEEAGEKLLASRNWRGEDAIRRLDEPRLSKLMKEFEIPPPPRPSLLAVSTYVTSPEQRFRDQIWSVAKGQRDPVAREIKTERPPPTPTSQTASAGMVQVNVSVSAAQGTPSSRPILPDVIAFVEGYRFGGQWDSERLYEAELLGALRTKFGVAHAFDQVNAIGGRIDIKVGEVGIEIKRPLTAKQAQDMVGQVLKYKGQFGPNLIAVIIRGEVNEHSLTQVVDQIKNEEIVVIEK